MSAQTLSIPVKAWYGDEKMKLQFPESWDVTECRMIGHDTPAMSDNEMSEALQNPLGTPPLKELAKGKKQVVILFDDLTRPAPTWRILPFVLDELEAADIPDDNIRFVTAYANHAAMSLEDFIKKLGKDVVQRFRIYNHNPYDHLEKVGESSRGTPILINKEVMSCDLKIGIGGLIPHLGAGFGGGAKLVIPGVAGIETADYNHRILGQLGGDRSVLKKLKLGKLEESEIRPDIEEAVRKVGLDFKVDLLINYQREVVGVFAGDFIEQHRAGVEKAKELYATQMAKDCDIVVMNTYPIENQMVKGIWPGRISLKEGGIGVVMVQSVEGQAAHYLAGRFGSDYGGKMWGATKQLAIPHAEKLLVCSSYQSRYDLDTYGPSEQVIPCTSWTEVMIQLLKKYPDKAKVAVYPYAAIQYPAED